jgi:hypothetical protein
MNKKEEKKIVVSSDFIEAYLNFNVLKQEDKIKSLSEKEKYLLLTFALDKHSDCDQTVVENFQPFKDEVMQIYAIQDDKETEVDIILELIEDTGDKYIDTDCIVDSEGHKLREPYNIQEIREIKIDKALNKE